MSADLRKLRFIVKTEALEAVTRHLTSIRRNASARLILEGERGLGKRTAIEHALGKHRAAAELVVLRGSADQFRSPLAPLAEAFSCLLQYNSHNDHVLRAAGRVTTELAQLVPFFSTLGGKVQDLFQGYLSPNAAFPILEAGDLIFRLQKVLRAIALEFHPVLIFSDIDQYDHSTLSIIGQLARKEGLDCSFILTCDPYAIELLSREQFGSFQSVLTSDLLFRKLKFSRFSLEQSEHFVGGVLGRGAASRAQIASIHKRSGGNPLFLRELLAHLAEEGHISGGSGNRKLHDTYQAAALPDSIWGLINIKLSRLPQELRTVIDLASVLGVEFNSEPISESLQLSHLFVLDRLRKLEIGYNLIEQMANSHRFSLEAIREAVYESLGPALAREHHLLLARYFERHPESPDIDYLLFYHYRRAIFPEQALEHLVRSAHSARSRLSYEEAAHRFRLAHELMVQLRGASDQNADGLRLEEGIAYFEAGDFPLAVARLTELTSLSRGCGIHATSLLYQSLAQYMLDEPAAARLTLDALFSHGLSTLSIDLRHRALMTKASVLYALGCWEEARRVYLRFIKEVPLGADILMADAVKRVNIFYLPELALPLLKKAQARIETRRHLPLYWEIHHNIGSNYLLLGELRSAEVYFRQALAEFDRMGTYRITYPLNNLGLVKLFQGDFDQAKELFEQVKAIARVDFDRMSAICHLAVIDCLSGQPENAIPNLEMLCEKTHGMSEAILVELIFHNLAWAYSLAGDYEKALQCFQTSPDVAKDLWSDFRSARRARMVANLVRKIGTEVGYDDSILDRTGRRDSWSFKKLDYEVNDIWCWE